jgi:hypothetical protein
VIIPIVTAFGGAAIGFIGGGGIRLLLDRRQELVKAQAFARVILDELHSIENLLDPVEPAMLFPGRCRHNRGLNTKRMSLLRSSMASSWRSPPHTGQSTQPMQLWQTPQRDGRMSCRLIRSLNPRFRTDSTRRSESCCF